MSTRVRETSWHSLCVQADPDFVRKSRIVVEYEFSTPGKTIGDERTHDGGRRIFRGDYQRRGPYVPEVVAEGGMTWRGAPITWNDDDLTWNG